MSALFEIDQLKVKIEEKEVIQSLSLQMKKSEVHALMGRNGSGKTSLSYSLMGHPDYKVLSGDVRLEGESLLELGPDERAKKGLFLGFQHPVGIPGVSVANFLRSAMRAIYGDSLDAKEIRSRIKEEIENLSIPNSFMTRFLNDGFSGGERKRLETLQLRLLKPKVAVLDETDSGLDIDALRQVAGRIDEMRSPERSLLLITHYQRMLDYIQPDFVHVLMNGKIVKSGGPELAKELEKNGYDWISEDAA